MMDRRMALSTLGLSAAGFLAASAAGGEAHEGHSDKHAHSGHEATVHGEHAKHLTVIGKCAMTCEHASHHALKQLLGEAKNREQLAKVHEYTMDCAAFCKLTASLMAHRSPLSTIAHRACADACRDCAAVCAKSDVKMLQDCAKICRECEQVCRKMAKEDAHQGHDPSAS